MDRRESLVLLGTLLFAPGCLDAGGTTRTDGGTPSSTDCETVQRPEPDAPDEDAEDAIEPVPYPDPPASSSESDVAAYVEAFERAYRRNALFERWGERLVGFGLSSHGVSTADADGGTRATFEYNYWENVEDEHGDGVIHGDSPMLRVVYYVDESGAWRAEDESPADEGSTPDARAAGDPVACFE